MVSESVEFKGHLPIHAPMPKECCWAWRPIYTPKPKEC